VPDFQSVKGLLHDLVGLTHRDFQSPGNLAVLVLVRALWDKAEPHPKCG